MNGITFYSLIDSPLGRLCVRGDGRFLTGLFLPVHQGWAGPDAAWRRNDTLFDDVRDQLAEYFAGRRQAFDLSLKLSGTPFQHSVWRQMA